MAHNEQIIWIIVFAIFINVVDYLARLKRTAQFFLGNDSMFVPTIALHIWMFFSSPT